MIEELKILKRLYEQELEKDLDWKTREVLTIEVQKVRNQIYYATPYCHRVVAGIQNRPGK